MGEVAHGPNRNEFPTRTRPLDGAIFPGPKTHAPTYSNVSPNSIFEPERAFPWRTKRIYTSAQIPPSVLYIYTYRYKRFVKKKLPYFVKKRRFGVLFFFEAGSQSFVVTNTYRKYARINKFIVNVMSYRPGAALKCAARPIYGSYKIWPYNEAAWNAPGRNKSKSTEPIYAFYTDRMRRDRVYCTLNARTRWL